MLSHISMQVCAQSRTQLRCSAFCQPLSHSALLCFLSVSVDTFRSLSSLSSPIDKLSCVVSVAKAICACVDRARATDASSGNASAGPSNSSPSPVVIGADDLLLLFTYLLLRGQLPSLLSELAFLSDFIPDHQRCSMYGYYVATTQAAAELLLSGDPFGAAMMRRRAMSSAAASPTATAEATSTPASPTNTDQPQTPASKEDGQLNGSTQPASPDGQASTQPLVSPSNLELNS